MEEACSEWDELRKEARRLEGELEVRLSSYAKLGGSISLLQNPNLVHFLIESKLL